MKLSNTTCIVTQNVIKIIENSINNITVNEIQENTVLGLTIKLTESVASAYSVEAHGHMTSSNVQSALQELADTFKAVGGGHEGGALETIIGEDTHTPHPHAVEAS